MKICEHNVTSVLQFSCSLLVAALPSVAYSQPVISPRAHIAAPDVYKVIAEGHQQRVMEAVLKPGQRSSATSHPQGTVTYYLTDCSLKVTEFGVDADINSPALTALITPTINSRTRLNVGNSDCKMIIVEPQ